MRLRLALLLTLTVLWLGATSAFAVGTFSMTVAPGPDSTWVFTLFNNDSSGNVIIPLGLDLEWDEGQAPDDYDVTGTPDGWVANGSFDFPAWDASASNEPSPGTSLSGFVVAAPTAPQNFTVYYSLDAEGLICEGTAEPVPEPGSLAGILAGLTSLGLGFIRRRA